jgi:hypothetical protein
MLCVFHGVQILRGRATLGNIGTLPAPTTYIPQIEGPPLPSHLIVPLQDGSTVPIFTLPPSSASLMLGIWLGPFSCGTKYNISRKCVGMDMTGQPGYIQDHSVMQKHGSALPCNFIPEWCGDHPRLFYHLENSTWQQNLTILYASLS